MMDFFKKNRATLGGGVLLVAAVYAYFTYFSDNTAPLTALSANSAISGDLLVTLNSLHTIRLDNAVFSSQVFVSLSDFGVTIPEQPAGRRNPFAPIGQGGSLGTTTGR